MLGRTHESPENTHLERLRNGREGSVEMMHLRRAAASAPTSAFASGLARHPAHVISGATVAQLPKMTCQRKRGSEDWSPSSLCRLLSMLWYRSSGLQAVVRQPELSALRRFMPPLVPTFALSTFALSPFLSSAKLVRASLSRPST
jgi:hypothetical protein